MENLKYTELLQLNKKMGELAFDISGEIGVLSNVTVNTFKDVLEYSCRIKGFNPIIEIGNYDNIVQDSLTFKSKNTVIIFYEVLNIIDSYSGFFENIDEDIYISLKRKMFLEIDIIFDNLKDVPSVIFNTFSGAYFPNNSLSETKVQLFVQELNHYLILKKTLNVTLLNIDQIFLKLSISESVDYRFYYSSKAPYTYKFFNTYSQLILPILLKSKGRLKKAIIFDCDNTLWKGIVGEDGIEGIDLSTNSKEGVFFNKIQQIAIYLSKMGVIIGVCSKNNEKDVLDVFQNHKDMVLKEDYLVIKKVNWIDKASNIKEISSELKIGLDSIVFVDDSDFEINLIQNQIPDVLTFQVPKKASEYVNFFLKMVYDNFNLVPTLEDLKKTEMYQQQFERSISENSHASIDEYLYSLEIEIKVVKDDIISFERISQLTQKTNQFNLTTFRYTAHEIKQFIDDPTTYVFSLYVKDKFGDNGLTGVGIIKEDKNNKNNVVLDSFLMSCRIIGRGIEYVFAENIIKEIEKVGYSTIGATFTPTNKNSQVETFYENLGLSCVNDHKGIKRYIADIKEINFKNSNYIKVS